MPGWRLLLLAVVLVAAGGCTGGDDAVATTTTSTSTTIGVTVRSSGERALTVGPDVDGGLAERLEAQLGELATVTEGLRGLAFLSPPQIVLLAEADFNARWDAHRNARLDPVALAADTRLFRLIGLLTPAQDLRTLLRSAATPVVAFYEGGAAEIVVAATEAELDDFDASVAVRSLVEALTDQYHRHTVLSGELDAAGRHDEATALRALAIADALTTQLRYLETLPDSARVIAAAEGGAYAPAPAPLFLQTELGYPTDDGLAFVAAVLDEGGLAGVDAAYGAELSTELISHPVRYLAGERATAVAVPEVALAGYEVQDRGSLGALGLRSLLGLAVAPGLLTQTVDGWGGDAFVTLASASDIAFVYLFRGDRVTDAVEVAQGFIDHAQLVMAMAEPLAAGGGVELIGPAPVEGEEAAETDETTPPPDGPYVYVDRSGAGLVVVIAGDAEAGRALVRQLETP